MRSAKQIHRLATTSKGPSRPTPFLLSSRQASTSTSTTPASSSTAPSFVPDLPPHLSTPSSLSQPIPRPTEQGFFTSRPTVVIPFRASQRESETFAELQDLVSKPSSYRTEIGSAKIWQKYISLSPAYRRSLPVDFLQRVFKYVIPNRKHVRELSSLPDSSEAKGKVLRERLKHHSNLGNKWERRLRTITNDIMSSNSNQKEVDPQVLINGVGKLAMLGDKNGCESIIREIRFRFDDKLTYRQLRIMYGYGLRSISKWLKIHSHRFTTTFTSAGGNSTTKGELELIETSEIARRLIKAMQERKVSPNSTTAENLLNISRLICSTNVRNDDLRRSFEELSETILVNGYNLDINNLSFPSKESDLRKLKPAVKLAVVDYFGRKGELYKMLAAYDNLFPGDVERLPESVLISRVGEDGVEDEEEDIPTLSRMLEDERRQRAERGWFGQRSVEEHGQEGPVPAFSESTLSQPTQTRSFNDYLPPIPTPYDILLPSSAISIKLQSLIATSPPQRPIDGEGAVVSSILSMLSRAWKSKIKVSPDDTIYKDVSIHILRLAVRAANIEQASFLHALKEGKADGSVGFGPNLRIEGNSFKACWRTVRWTRSSSRRGMKYSRVILGELNDVKKRLEEERAILASFISEPESTQEDQVEAESSSNVGVEAVVNQIKGLDSLRVELDEIEEQIHANLQVATERKARSNSARVVKLEERREAQLAYKGRKKGFLGMTKAQEKEKETWTIESTATASPAMA
ncbi:hypothetical protein I302_106543 [Kwoniella bestiolae CBS 10118]|uniref:Uncharacterized protein n=1 Tax=Kwoniella bestiolae CBS 10118 TaxID=1296100 RepID=A0A1B9G128_9TREE|nr:hypothetical protein I302_06195 [Kwoniella bestiolae CBS 10118]OCF24734.1 hypothetical protein I302_06195 [Kwoniella bestiolae CBS 10118]